MKYQNLVLIPNGNNIPVNKSSLAPLKYGKIKHNDDRHQYIIRTDTYEEMLSICLEGEFFRGAVNLNKRYRYEIGYDNCGNLILVPIMFLREGGSQ